MSFFSELQRRNVFRMAILYIVTSWLILQVGDVLAGFLELPDSTLRLIFLLAVLGFFPAVIFSWVYELTPEGIRREREIARDESITNLTAKRLDLTVIVLLLVSLGVFFIHQSWRPSAVTDPAPLAATPAEQAVPDEVTTTELVEKPAEKSYDAVAVLAFDDLSPERDQEYFADGISEELLNILANQGLFQVAARTSSFAFKGRNMPIDEIGETLGVDAILEGSIRKAGNTLRITAQLVDSASGYHLWSDTFDRELKDVFAIQDEIAAAIVNAMNVTLGRNEGQAKTIGAYEPKLEAYDAYLEGQYYLEKRSTEGLQKARALFEKAIEIDLQYAAPRAALATYYLLSQRGFSTYGTLSRDEALALAKPHIDRALELAPHSAAVQLAHGHWLHNNREPDAALAAYDRTLELNPNSVTALRWKSILLSDQGRVMEARDPILRAAELDPISPIVLQNVLAVHEYFGEIELAKQAANKAMRMHPDDQMAVVSAAQIETKDWPRQHQLLKQAEALDPANSGVRTRLGWSYADVQLWELADTYADTEMDRAWVKALAGGEQAALAQAKAWVEEKPDDVFRVTELGMMLQFLGKAAEARPLLEKGALASTKYDGPLSAGCPCTGWLDVAWVRRLTGDEKGANEAIAIEQERLGELRQAGVDNASQRYNEARLAAYNGDRDASVEKLEATLAVHVFPFHFYRDPIFQNALQDDPRWQQIVADTQERIEEAQREILAQLDEDEPRSTPIAI